jgi:hypothetical protein
VSRRTRFTQSDVTRAVKGAQAAGLIVSRVEVDDAGRIVIISQGAATEAPSAADAWSGIIERPITSSSRAAGTGARKRKCERLGSSG